MALEPIEPDSVETEEFAFKYLGGVQFRTVDQPVDAPGSSRAVAVSSLYGLTAFTDTEGTAWLAHDRICLQGLTSPSLCAGAALNVRLLNGAWCCTQGCTWRGQQICSLLRTRRLAMKGGSRAWCICWPQQRVKSSTTDTPHAHGHTPRMLTQTTTHPAPHSYQPVDPASVCVCHLPSCRDVSQLELSADELVLACVAGSTVSFFSLPSLADGNPQPVAEYTLSDIKQFTWCKDPSHVNHYLIVAEEGEGTLHAATYPAHPQQIAQQVTSVAWSPSGTDN